MSTGIRFQRFVVGLEVSLFSNAVEKYMYFGEVVLLRDVICRSNQDHMPSKAS